MAASGTCQSQMPMPAASWANLSRSSDSRSAASACLTWVMSLAMDEMAIRSPPIPQVPTRYLEQRVRSRERRKRISHLYRVEAYVFRNKWRGERHTDSVDKRDHRQRDCKNDHPIAHARGFSATKVWV